MSKRADEFVIVDDPIVDDQMDSAKIAFWFSRFLFEPVKPVAIRNTHVWVFKALPEETNDEQSPA